MVCSLRYHDGKSMKLCFTQAGHVPSSTSVVVPATVFLLTSQWCAHLQRKKKIYQLALKIHFCFLKKKVSDVSDVLKNHWKCLIPIPFYVRDFKIALPKYEDNLTFLKSYLNQDIIRTFWLLCKLEHLQNVINSHIFLGMFWWRI